ncbi:MAG: hypothetical protein JWP89_805 [Schlesneria sp.]|nr:hypothetical protein [Schlesneria sp.]
MSAQQWPRFALLSFAVLACEVYTGFGISFNPGWANGWPFGITIHVVFSTVMSVLSFLILMTASSFVGSLIASCFAAIGVGDRHLRPAFILLIICCTAPAAILAQMCFMEIYASTFKMWPDGYPVGR